MSDAYALLSKPTQELTDAEVEAVFADLRIRRERFLQGVQDKPAAKPKAPAKTKEEKAAITSGLMDDLLSTPIGEIK